VPFAQRYCWARRAAQLRTIGQVQIFRQCVVLPAASVSDHLFAPNSAGSCEVEQTSRREPRLVFDHVVAVEQQGLSARQQRVFAVQVCPTGLHHGHLRILEVADDVRQKLRLRDEVGIENRDEFTSCRTQAVIESTCLVPDAVRSTNVCDVEPLILELGDFAAREHARFVVGVVEHLDVQEFARVLDLRDGIQQAFDDGGFVVQRQLDRHSGELGG
jgi:hypothetical protein